MSKKKIVAAIEQNQRFLLSAHINPDGDALGSELALAMALRQMGKEVVISNKDLTPEDYLFLPHVEEIKTPVEAGKNFDALIVLDCGQFDRISAFSRKDFNLVLNIDHHITNDNFADITWRRKTASSTAELVFELLCVLPVTITPEIAVCIYTGLMTDTGAFRYTNTTDKSFQLAARLVKYGVKPAQVASQVYERMTLARMRLLGEMLETLEIHNEGAVASVVVTQQMLNECGAVASDTEDFVNYPRAIQEVEVAVFIRELEKDYYKISLRSKTKANVAQLAEKFNGGGHIHAAGCYLRGSLEAVKQQLFSELSVALKET